MVSLTNDGVFASSETAVFASYLADKPRHELDNVLVITELPDDHHNLFHGHLVAGILPENLINKFLFEGLIVFVRHFPGHVSSFLGG